MASMVVEQNEQNEQNELFNVFHRLDWIDDWLRNGNGKLDSQIFWSLIDIRIPLDLEKYNKSIRWATSGAGNPGNGNGWGVIQQKLAPHLYELTNVTPNIMDWRATEAVCNHFMQYKGLKYPDRAHKRNHLLYIYYEQSHALLVQKYKKILEFAFNTDEFTEFLKSRNVEFANMKYISHITGEESIIRNVVRSFPNYWYDSNADPKPTYLYHYKKMNFLLKTIADCNYLAFDIILDKVNTTEHSHLLHGYITLNNNVTQNRSNIRRRFDDIELDYQELPSRFNPDTIDNAVSGRGSSRGLRWEDPTDLFLEVAERSGIRERHNNKHGYESLKPNNRSNILNGEWKYDWLFQHTYAGDRDYKSYRTVGNIQPGLNKKYILTFILQHAYETNDRKLFESYRRFRHIYGTDYYGNTVNTHPTIKPYFEAHYYGGGGDKGEWLKIRSFEFIDESLPQTDDSTNKSACERWLEFYNKELIKVGKKFLKKLELQEYITVKNNKIEFQKAKKEIHDATKFFLASVDKKPLKKGTNGGFQNGHSNTTSAFMVENQDWITPAKRGWLWWSKNDITSKDRIKKEEEQQANKAGMPNEYRELIGSEGFSGFYGIINLFGSTYNLNNVYSYTNESLQTMVSILTFKQTLNNVFEDEYKKQANVQKFLNLLVIDRQLEGMQIHPTKRNPSAIASVMGNKDIINKIVTFGGRKKTKSKYNKRMSKRTRRKRGGNRINSPTGLEEGKTYKISCNDDDATDEFKAGLLVEYKGIVESHFGDPVYNFTYTKNYGNNRKVGDTFLPVHYGHDEDFAGSDDESYSVSDIERVTDRFFVFTNRITNIVIESVNAGGRRRRRKKKTKRKKKKKRRKRKGTKKKRRKR